MFLNSRKEYPYSMELTDKYISEIRKQLYSLTDADDFLKELNNDLSYFIQDNPECSMDDIIEQFGSPEDVAKEILDSSPDFVPAKLASQNRRKWVIIAVLCIVLIVAAIYTTVLSTQTQSRATDVITVYEDEPASENSN